jgi:hypothetical protein
VIVAGIAQGHQEGGIEADIAANTCGRPVVCKQADLITFVIIDVV